MEMLNRATEDAAAFRGMLDKVTRVPVQPVSRASPEVIAWNAEVDRKRAAKKAGKVAAKVQP